jgi:hypothetical protein
MTVWLTEPKPYLRDKLTVMDKLAIRDFCEKHNHDIMVMNTFYRIAFVDGILEDGIIVTPVIEEYDNGFFRFFKRDIIISSDFRLIECSKISKVDLIRIVRVPAWLNPYKILDSLS